MRRLLALPLLAVLACTDPDPPPGPAADQVTYWHAVHADGRFVAVGGDYDGNHAAIATSVDGVSWEVAEMEHGGLLRTVAFGGGRWVAAGDTSMWVSDDGTAWRPVPHQIGATGIAYGNGVFVVTSDGAYVAISPDGETWTDVEIGEYWWSPEVVFAGDRFVVYGEGSALAESNDGADWLFGDLGVTGTHRVVARGDRVVGVGYYDCCFGEVEGARMAIVMEGPGTWSSRGREGIELTDVVFVAGTVIGATFEGLVRGPDSGLDRWQLEAVAPASPWTSLATDGSTVIAAGESIQVSRDQGATWTVAVRPDPE